MKPSTQVAIGIFAVLAAYLIYRVYENYTTVGNPLGNPMANPNPVSSSNLQQPTSNPMLAMPMVQDLVPQVSPSTGPAFETRSGRGHF